MSTPVNASLHFLMSACRDRQLWAVEAAMREEHPHDAALALVEFVKAQLIISNEKRGEDDQLELCMQSRDVFERAFAWIKERKPISALLAATHIKNQTKEAYPSTMFNNENRWMANLDDKIIDLLLNSPVRHDEIMMDAFESLVSDEADLFALHDDVSADALLGKMTVLCKDIPKAELRASLAALIMDACIGWDMHVTSVEEKFQIVRDMFDAAISEMPVMEAAELLVDLDTGLANAWDECPLKAVLVQAAERVAGAIQAQQATLRVMTPSVFIKRYPG